MTDDKVTYSHTTEGLDFLMEHTHGAAFRKKIEPCPYCEPNCGMFEKPKFATEWGKEGIVREIVFVRHVGRYYKKGHVIMVSACPRCRKLSFHHRPIEWLLRDPWADKEVVQAEIDGWTQESLDKYNNSLCARCNVKQNLERNPYGYLVNCDAGYLFPADPWEQDTFRCKNYIPVDPDTCLYCGEKPGTHDECQAKMNKINRDGYNRWLKQMHGLGTYLDRDFLPDCDECSGKFACDTCPTFQYAEEEKDD